MMFRAVQISVIFFVLGMGASCQYVSEIGWLQNRPSDSHVTQAVLQALKYDPELEDITFHVETSERIVYISGYVKTIRQSDEAQKIASRTRGVRKVENNIIVKK